MMFRLRKSEWFVILLLLTSGIGFLVLFFLDLYHRIDISEKDIIGIVEYKNNIVQRKLDGHMVWEAIQKNSPIVNRDTIRSDSRSDALIRLYNGTFISMDENSMFYLDISGKSPNLNLTQGNLSVKKLNGSGESLHILSDDTVISVQEGSLNLNKAKDGKISLFLEKGDAFVLQRGKIHRIDSDKIVNIHKDGIFATKLVFQLVYPTNHAILPTLLDQELIEFQWKPLQTYTNHRLQIAQSPEFDEQFVTIDNPSQSEKVRLKPGTYYWRITAQEGNSPVFRFQIFKESTVSSKAPPDNTIFSYVEKLPAVFFQWSDDPLAKEYVLEISEDKKFENLASRYPTKTNRVAVDSLNQGEYFWRVKTTPIDATLPEKVTEPQKIRIQKASEFSPPVLIRPLNQAWGENEYVKNGIFLWQGSREYLEYEFNLSQSPEFVGNVFVSREEKNFFKPKEPLKPGTYFWRVRGRAFSGKTSAYSAVGRFQIFAEGQSKESVRIETAPVALSESKPPTQPGKKPYPPAPDLPSTPSIALYPKDTVVDLSGASFLDFEWLRWKTGREEYILSLYKEEKNSRRPVFQVKTRANSYSYKNLRNLEEGRFSWEIAVLSGGKTVHRETSHFLITIGMLRALSSEDIQFITPSVLYRTSRREKN